MPHNEWLCAKLAERVGISTPPIKVVEVQGIRCFGSRWQPGEEQDWWVKAYQKIIPFDDLAPSLSKIYAFDLFVNNVDRHLNNFFVQKQRNSYSVLAMDFGISWLFSGMPPPQLPMPNHENTIGDFRKLVMLFGSFIDQNEVEELCLNLSNISTGEITSFIDSHPKEWLKEDVRNAIENWWSSPARLDRIAGIAKGIKDGSYL